MKIPAWVRKIRNPRIKSQRFIPIYSPYFHGREKEYLINCLDTTWISSKSDLVDDYEKKFARFCGSKYALAVSSGTSALFLALKVSGIKKNDEVILPTFTMISSANAVSYLSAKPVFADCRLADGNTDYDEIEKNITPRTKAVMPVHIYGNPCAIENIRKLAEKYHLTVIEDAAEAFGSEFIGRRIGSGENPACFSTYINKIITTGEGGMITLNSDKLFRKLRRLNHYFFSPRRHFWHQAVGYNFKLNGLSAAIGIAQLEQAEEILLKKRQIHKNYREFLKPVREFFYQMNVIPDGKSNYWHIAYRVAKIEYNAVRLRKFLAVKGIETRSFFIPLHLQPPYRKKEYEKRYPNSVILARTGILLPSGPDLTIDQQERIAELIKRYFLH